MALTHQQVFERYAYAGSVARDPDAMAAMFTEDGILDTPLAPTNHPLHGRLVGRAAIRAAIAQYHQQPPHPGTVNLDRSAYVLHDTLDPDTFIAELDVAFDHPDGHRTTMSLIRIFRLHNDHIAMLRDYFVEPPSNDH